MYIFMFHLIFEDFIDQPLVGGTCIFQAKGHDPIIKEILASNKNCFLILRYYPDLVIASKSIYESVELMAQSCIYQLIDSREWIVVLWASII